MDFQEKLINVKEALPLLTINVTPSNNNYSITNLDQLKKGLAIIENIAPISVYVNAIKTESPLYRNAANNQSFAQQDYQNLISNLNEIRSSIKAIINFTDSIITTEENCIQIKLPPTKTFDELQKYAGDLKRAIDLPISSSKIEGRKTEIITAEPGSIWLIVALGAKLAVELVGIILKSSLKVSKEKKEEKFIHDRLSSYS